MLLAKDFKSLPEWIKIETEILKAIAQATDNTLGLALEGKQICQAEAAKAFTLAWVLTLPDELLKDEIPAEIKKLNGSAEGISILARRGSQLF